MSRNRRCSPHCQKRKGFTLLEVLVALLILAIVMVAVLKAIHLQISGENHIKKISVARWVGMDILAKAQSGLIDVKFKTEGVEKAFGQTWYWRVTTEKLSDKNLNQVDVAVGLSSDKAPVAHVRGVIR